MSTEDNLEGIRTALAKEREQHKQTRDKLKANNHLLANKLAAAERAIKESTIVADPTAERLSQFIAESTRAQLAEATSNHLGRIAALEDELASARKATADIKSSLETRTVESVLRDAMKQEHVLETASGDVLTLGRLELKLQEDGTIKTDDGLTAQEWLDNRKQISPYWWPLAVSSGGKNGRSARGSMHPSEIGMGILTGDGNPFAKNSASWSLTEQSRMTRENPALAARMKAAAE